MRRPVPIFAIVAGLLLAAGCPPASECPSGGTTASATGGSSQIGGPVLGPVDNHCWAPGPSDGGLTFMAQVVTGGNCYVIDGGAAFDEDAGTAGSAYGPTEWNVSGNDDDCKYFVGWHSTPISQGAEVTFWVSVQLAINGAPLTGLAESLDGGSGTIYLEVAGAPDGGVIGHASPTTGEDVATEEIPAGSGIYRIGPAAFFDESGLWYVRFHFNANCQDILPDSPHGHAAFYVNVP